MITQTRQKHKKTGILDNLVRDMYVLIKEIFTFLKSIFKFSRKQSLAELVAVFTRLGVIKQRFHLLFG